MLTRISRSRLKTVDPGKYPRPKATGQAHLYPLLLGYGMWLLLVVIGWIGFALSQHDLVAWLQRYDFLTMYIGAQAVATGHGASLYDPGFTARIGAEAVAPYDRPMMYLFVYPGYDAVVLAPLGALSFPVAYFVWGAINLALAAAVIGAWLHMIPATRAERIAIGLGMAGFVPLLLTVLQGQWGLVVTAGLTGAVLAARRGHEKAGGAWMLLGLIKPQLVIGPLLNWAGARRWQALAAWAVGVVAVLLVSSLVLGMWLPDYVPVLLGNINGSEGFADVAGAMHNWRALVDGLAGSGTLAGLLVAALSAASVAGIVALSWPIKAAQHLPQEVRLALSALLGVLIVPHLYLHDWVVGLVPGMLLWSATAEEQLMPTRRRIMRGLLAAGPLVALAAQFTAFSPVPPFPWYVLIVMGVSLWTWADSTRSVERPVGAWQTGNIEV